MVDDAKSLQHTMTQPLRVLIVEDTESDERLVLRALRRGGYEPFAERVESGEAMRAALSRQTWDLILSDYVIPGFGGLEALNIAKQSGFDLPFILVSNKVSEEILVGAMRAGAMDFVMKDRLERLVPVVKRELNDAAARSSAKRAQIEWRAALDSVQDAIFIHDAEFRIVRANLAYARLAEMPIKDVIGKLYWKVFPKADGPLSGCRDVCAGKTDLAEDVVRLSTGEVFSSRAFPIADGTGSGRHYLHVMQNTTERDRVREAIESSEKRFRALLEHGSDLVIVVDARGTIAYTSPSVKQIAGFEIADVLGRSYVDFTHPEDQAAAIAELSTIIREPNLVHRSEFRFRRNDGTWTTLESVARNALDDPLINGIVVNARDITERKRSERALQKVNRALKVLSAGNMELVRATNETALLEAVCRAVVEVGGYLVAWVGYAQEDAGKSVIPQAAAGIALDALRAQHMTWDDREHGRGPSSRALRSGEVQVAQDVSRDSGINPWRELARKHGIASVISLPLRFNGQVLGVLSIHAGELNAFNDEEVRLLTEMAGDLAFGIRGLRMREERDRAMDENRRSLERLGAVLESTIEAVALTVEKRDPYTAGHQRRVAELSVAIGRELGLSAERIEGLRLGATIHDIGKISVPAEILARPGRLLPSEMEIIKTHSSVGFEIVKGIDFPWPIAQMILQHHERLDGSGYPQALKGDEIIVEARVIAVADVVEAMSSHRPYRPGLGLDVALAQVRQDAGTKLDDAAVAACERLFREKGFQLPT